MARISYNVPETKGGNYVWTMVNSVIVDAQSAARLKTQMEAIVGFPADYTKLEVPFGLVAGSGQAFYNSLVNLKVNLDAATAQLGDLDRIA